MDGLLNRGTPAMHRGPGSAPNKVAHWIALTGIFIFLAGAVFLWSTRGQGRPDPIDMRSSTAAVAAKSAAERDAAIFRFSLLCMDSLRKAKPDQAISQCGLVLDLDPRNFTALNLRGSAHMMAGHPNSALADFSQVIRLFPDYPDAYRFRGTIYAAQHRNTLALSDLNRAIALAPNDPANFEFRGHFHQMTGDFKAAIADFSVVIARQPMLARVWNSRCWSRFAANTELQQGLADCDRSLQLDPTNANAFDSRGYVLYRMNRIVVALTSFDRAVKINAKLSSALLGRGLCKLRIHDLTAPRDIAKAKQLEPGIEARFAAYGIKLRASGPSGA